MMHECARILNKQVIGEGLWHVDLSKCQNKQEGEVMEIIPHEDALEDNVAVAGATEHSDGEDASDKPNEDAEDQDDAVNDEVIDADAKMAGNAKLPDIEETSDNPDDSAEHQEHATKDTTPLAGAAEHDDVAYRVPLTGINQKHKCFTSLSHCETTGCIEATHCKIWTYRPMRNTSSGQPSLFAVQICRR